MVGKQRDCTAYRTLRRYSTRTMMCRSKKGGILMRTGEEILSEENMKFVSQALLEEDVCW